MSVPRWDFSTMEAPTDLESREASVRRTFEENLAAGRYGFAKLGGLRGQIEKIEEFAREEGGKYEAVLHIGIGGSALGASALLTALAGPYHLVEGSPRIFVVDNVDPEELREVLDLVEPERTLVHVVSKSGGTMETLVGLRLALQGADWRERVVVTTDPEKGPLRAWAREHRLPAFEIPPDIGGRFSVFTAVGMLPAALAGIDVTAILEGAEAAQKERHGPLRAALLNAHHMGRGRNVHVTWAYARALKETASWFGQLWAESLGKQGKGQTPVAALGATDQHSILQLLQEGPDDKVIAAVYPKRWREDMTIPPGPGDRPEIDGRRVSEVFEAEREGVLAALTAAKRPVYRIEIDEVSPESMGALLYQWMEMTAFGGIALGVDAFDQPGVEMGKREALKRLAR